MHFFHQSAYAGRTVALEIWNYFSNSLTDSLSSERADPVKL